MARFPFVGDTRAPASYLARSRRLAVHGNARRAAAELGVNRATYTKRRARCARLATLWDAALAFAHAQIRETQNHPRSSRAKSRGAGTESEPTPFDFAQDERSPRAKGGEPILVRLKSGRVQLRRAPKGRMTKAAEQAFLRALSSTCNVRLSAAAAGFTHSAFYQRAKKDPGFAREWRLAEERGWHALEGALLAGFLPDSHEDDAWRHNEPPDMPAMTVDQAIQLAFLHEKSVRRAIPARRATRDEPFWDAYCRALREHHQEKGLRALEESALTRAARAEPRGAWRRVEDGEGIAVLPQLDQVSGWSGADPEKKVHDPDKAMFGGWRIADWKNRER